jgi:hypothetical protein
MTRKIRFEISGTMVAEDEVMATDLWIKTLRKLKFLDKVETLDIEHRE